MTNRKSSCKDNVYKHITPSKLYALLQTMESVDLASLDEDGQPDLSLRMTVDKRDGGQADSDYRQLIDDSPVHEVCVVPP